MIARIKATGKLIDVVPYGDEFAQLFPEGDFKVYTKDELDFRVDVDWNQVRIQAAIAAMDIVKGAYNIHNDIERLVRHSVKVADALVTELQKKGGKE
jgi:hypothetical protein